METSRLKRSEALQFVEHIRVLAQRDQTFCLELAKQLSPAEIAVLRSHLRDVGKAFSMDWALESKCGRREQYET